MTSTRHWAPLPLHWCTAQLSQDFWVTHCWTDQSTFFFKSLLFYDCPCLRQVAWGCKALPREKSHLDLHILYHFIMCGNPHFVPVFCWAQKRNRTLEPWNLLLGCKPGLVSVELNLRTGDIVWTPKAGRQAGRPVSVITIYYAILWYIYIYN